MDFVLTGMGQDDNIRRYIFDAVSANRTRTQFSVRADLTLVRKYEIPLQELPLLCRHLLEEHSLTQESRTLTFTENDMISYVTHRAAVKDAADQKRKAHKRPVSNRVGLAWRATSSRFAPQKDITAASDRTPSKI